MEAASGTACLRLGEPRSSPLCLGTPQDPSESVGVRLLQQPHRGPASSGPDTRWPRGFPGAVASSAAGRFRPAWLWGSPGQPASGPSLRLAPAMATGQRLALLSRGMRLGTLGFLFFCHPSTSFCNVWYLDTSEKCEYFCTLGDWGSAPPQAIPVLGAIRGGQNRPHQGLPLHGLLGRAGQSAHPGTLS